MNKLDVELFNKYKKLGRGSWGKNLALFKAMYMAFLNRVKDEDFTPVVELLLNIFLDIRKTRKEGTPIIMYPFNYGPETFHAMDFTPLMQEVVL